MGLDLRGRKDILLRYGTNAGRCTGNWGELTVGGGYLRKELE